MVQGRIPEIAIRFYQRPELPVQGKKVVLEIQGENNVIVKAEVNRKTLKRQVAGIDEYENWVGVVSGKIAQITADGEIELENAGVRIFEKKKKEPKPEAEAELVADES